MREAFELLGGEGVEQGDARKETAAIHWIGVSDMEFLA